LRSVREVVVSRGDIVVSSGRELVQTSVKVCRSVIEFSAVRNLVVGAIRVISVVVDTPRIVPNVNKGKFLSSGSVVVPHGHAGGRQREVRLLVAVLQHVRSGRVLPSFSVVRVVGGVEIRPAELDMEIIVGCDAEDIRNEIRLNCWVALDNISSSSSVVQIVDGSNESSRARHESQHIRTILESSRDLVGVEGNSQGRGSITGDIDIRSIVQRDIVQRQGVMALSVGVSRGRSIVLIG